MRTIHFRAPLSTPFQHPNPVSERSDVSAAPMSIWHSPHASGVCDNFPFSRTTTGWKDGTGTAGPIFTNYRAF